MASIKKIPAKNKQGYKWRCVMEGPPDPVTGERRQIPRVRDTKQEAIDAAQEAVNILHSGIDLKKAKRTSFREATEGWMEDYSKRQVKNSTIRSRSKSLLVLLRHIDKQSVETITPTQYQKILYSLFDEGYAEAYIRNIHITASMVFEWSILNRLRSDNPAKGAKMPKKKLTVEDIERDVVREKYLERTELQEFLAAVETRGLDNDEEVFYLLTYSGLRPGELCALTWPDINFKTNEIRVTKTLYVPDRSGGEVEITPPKTEGSIRTFDLDDVIIEKLRNLKEVQKLRNERYQKLNSDFHKNNFIFTRPNGRPITQKTLLLRMDRLLKRTSITKKATPHIFRHTHVSMLAEAGVDLTVIMRRVGHDDAKTTLKVYTHVTNLMRENANQRIKIHFGKILNPE
ncbi:tyrosine-type recombinase/integrase [Paenibacillus agri]|uniref:Tyrosine-type recombinase/integrase n=1 Tax=Paenibacillus agri TaxID=2744309 RepID=A0A850ES87_9BACL|nr:tyrosine-type recombinase/integrase [Paenibacillus agri]NUU62650.1 tyrosine-type recombinase/integrase [Paenibacillus agri]